ncbi:MAG TPA: hypothetical protein VK177_10975 [Flavobacteriales bacterium]|nr:hypothetical protein [Flavobacteriales bacterium]
MEITYESLQQIIITEKVNGNILECAFRANNQLGYLKAQFVLMNDESEREKALVKKFISFVNRSSQAQSVFQVKEDLVQPTARNITSEELKRGVINAFKNVSAHYKFQNGIWKYADE